ncbi:hypothetical protein ACWGLF_36575 [Streptomyces puniciscabiei]
MALTRPVPDTGRPPANRTPLGPAGEPAGAAHPAARLEMLLGDPRVPGTPCGRSALRAAGYDDLPAPPAAALGVEEPRPAADRLAGALRPLFRRDPALAPARSIPPPPSTPVDCDLHATRLLW